MLKSILRRGPPASTVAPVSDEEDVFQDGEEGEQQADATIFGRHDAAIVWRQRLLRYSVFLAVLAGAGVGAGLSFTNGRLGQLRAFDEHYEQVAWRIGDELTRSYRDIVRSGIELAAVLSSENSLVLQDSRFKLSALHLLTMSPAATRMSRNAIFQNKTQPELRAALQQFAEHSGSTSQQAVNSSLEVTLSQGYLPPDALNRTWIPAVDVVNRPSAAEVASGALPARIFTEGLLEDLASDATRLAAVASAVASGRPALTDAFSGETSSTATLVVPVPANASLSSLLLACFAEPAVVVPSDVFSAASVSEVVAVTFSFLAMLSTVLNPRVETNVFVVITAPGGDAFTYLIDWSAAVALGAGDRHERVDYLDPFVRRVALGEGNWSAFVYPSVRLRESYVTTEPARDAIVIGGMVLLAGLVFGWYEFYVQARSRNLIRELKDTLERLFTLNSRLHVAIMEQRAEADLRIKAESAALEKQRMFTMMISHEVRTPLNALLGAATLLAETEMTREQIELLELLDAGANHVVLIVDDILNFGAIESGNFPLANEPLNLVRAVVEPSWRMTSMSRVHGEKLATLRMRKYVAPDVPMVIMGDAARLVQVVTNMLANSVKFTPEGGTIDLELRVSKKPPASLAASGRLLVGAGANGVMQSTDFFPRRSLDTAADPEAGQARVTDMTNQNSTGGGAAGSQRGAGLGGWADDVGGQNGQPQGGALILGGLDVRAEMSQARALLSRAQSLGRQGRSKPVRRASFSAYAGRVTHFNEAFNKSGDGGPQQSDTGKGRIAGAIGRSGAGSDFPGGGGDGGGARNFVQQSNRGSTDYDPPRHRFPTQGGESGRIALGGGGAGLGRERSGIGAALAAAVAALPRISSVLASAGSHSFMTGSVRLPEPARPLGSGVAVDPHQVSGIYARPVGAYAGGSVNAFPSGVRAMRQTSTVEEGGDSLCAQSSRPLAALQSARSSVGGGGPVAVERPSGVHGGGGVSGDVGGPAGDSDFARNPSPPPAAHPMSKSANTASAGGTGAAAGGTDGTPLSASTTTTAQDASRPGGVRPIRLLSRISSLAARAAAGQPDLWLHFIVRDTGIGLAPENFERVFEPFQQADLTTARKYGGTGLGLTICRSLARCMGGDMTAFSPGLGMGSTFTFSIPAVLAPVGALEDGGQGLVPQGPRMSMSVGQQNGVSIPGWSPSVRPSSAAAPGAAAAVAGLGRGSGPTRGGGTAAAEASIRGESAAILVSRRRTSLESMLPAGPGHHGAGAGSSVAGGAVGAIPESGQHSRVNALFTRDTSSTADWRSGPDTEGTLPQMMHGEAAWKGTMAAAAAAAAPWVGSGASAGSLPSSPGRGAAAPAAESTAAWLDQGAVGRSETSSHDFLLEKERHSSALSNQRAAGMPTRVPTSPGGRSESLDDPYYPSDDKRASNGVGHRAFGDAASRRSSLPSSHPLGLRLPTFTSSGGEGGPQKRLLVAEDDKLSQIVIRRILGKLGYEVTIAENGLIAVETFKTAEVPFDMILMDLNMPFMDGFDAARAILAICKERGTDIPIVALSAATAQEERERCKVAGMLGFLTKPIKPEHFEKIEQVVQKQRGRNNSFFMS